MIINDNSEKIVSNKTNISYEDFLSNIKKYYLRQQSIFVEERNNKLEKFRDKLYRKSVKHDKHIKQLEQQEKYALEKYRVKHQKITIMFEDYKISEKEYKIMLNKFDKDFNSGKNIKEKFEAKKHKLEIKFQKQTKKFSNLNKIKVQKSKKNLEKKCLIINKHKTQAIENLENKKQLVLDSNSNYIQKMKNIKKNLIAKYDEELNSLKQKKNQKIIGKHTFQKQKMKFDLKFKMKINKINNQILNYKPHILNATILKQKSLRVIQENNDKYFILNILKEMKNIISKNKIIFIILMLLFYTSMYNSYFWKIDTLLITMKGSSEVIILALAMTLVIITGGIDLSVGSVMAFSGVVMCSLAKNGTNIYVAVLVGIIVSTLIGLMNGILIGYAKIVPFIVTLAGLLAFRGLAIIRANSKPILLQGSAATAFDSFSNASFLGINAQIWVIIVCVLIFVFVLKFTIFGRQVFAIGSNRQAAYLSGVKTKKVEMMVYTISGFMAGLAALLISSRVQGIQPSAGNAWELKAIAATVLGGTALTGGKGGIIGTFIGWTILSFMPTVFVTLGYDSQVEKVATGLIIIIAIFFNNNLDLKGGLHSAKERCIKLFKQHFLRRKN